MPKVARLWRYPVKSMLGEECEHLELNERGVEGDRAFAIRDPDGKIGSGKTTRRFRRIDGLLSLQSAYEEGVPRIIFPDGRCLSGADPSVHDALSGILGRSVRLEKETDVPHLDAGPVHILTNASLAWLGSFSPGVQADPRRFRANLFLDVPGESRVEQAWIGKTLCIGDHARVRITGPTERCLMVGMAQDDFGEDPRILRTIATHAGSCFGVYAEVLVPGRIEIGADVRIST